MELHPEIKHFRINFLLLYQIESIFTASCPFSTSSVAFGPLSVLGVLVCLLDLSEMGVLVCLGFY